MSEIVVGQNHRVALWCDTDGTLVGNPASVEDVNRMWNAHVEGPGDDD